MDEPPLADDPLSRLLADSSVDPAPAGAGERVSRIVAAVMAVLVFVGFAAGVAGVLWFVLTPGPNGISIAQTVVTFLFG
jgi:hypothetical protein